MDECELIALITAVACAISKNCSEDDISILAAVFTQLGDTLATILVKRELQEKNSENQNTIDSHCNSSNDHEITTK